MKASTEGQSKSSTEMCGSVDDNDDNDDGSEERRSNRRHAGETVK